MAGLDAGWAGASGTAERRPAWGRCACPTANEKAKEGATPKQQGLLPQTSHNALRVNFVSTGILML